MIVLVRNRTLRGNEAALPPMENLNSLLLVKEDFVLMTAGNKSRRDASIDCMAGKGPNA
jgi:hypothetical protein